MSTVGAKADLSINSGGTWSFSARSASGSAVNFWGGANTSVSSLGSSSTTALGGSGSSIPDVVTGSSHSHGITQNNHSHTINAFNTNYNGSSTNTESRPDNLTIKIWKRVS